MGFVILVAQSGLDFGYVAHLG